MYFYRIFSYFTNSYFLFIFKNNFQKRGGSLIDNCQIKEIVPEGPEKIKLILHVLFIPYFRLLVFGILVTLVPFFFRLAHLALQNVNKDYVIFS